MGGSRGEDPGEDIGFFVNRTHFGQISKKSYELGTKRKIHQGSHRESQLVYTTNEAGIAHKRWVGVDDHVESDSETVVCEKAEVEKTKRTVIPLTRPDGDLTVEFDNMSVTDTIPPMSSLAKKVMEQDERKKMIHRKEVVFGSPHLIRSAW